MVTPLKCEQSKLYVVLVRTCMPECTLTTTVFSSCIPSPSADEEDEGKAALVNQLEEFLSGFVEHVLPRVGKSVQTLSLAYGGEVDSDLVSHHPRRGWTE